MTLDRFRLLHLRRMGRSRLRTTASALGIAAGVALVVSMTALMASATATARGTVSLLGGARYEVLTAAADREGLRTDLAAVDGVTTVRRYVEVPVMVDGTLGWLVSIEAGDRPPGTPEAQALAATSGVRTGTALPSGGRHTITSVGGTPVTVTVDGRADTVLAGRFGGLVVTADLDRAVRLAGEAGPETLLVSGNPDPAVLATVAGDRAQIHPVADREAQARNTVQLLFSSLSVLGALGFVVGSFLVFNTINMAVLDRRGEIATLRALGSDRRSTWSGVMAESALVGAVGSLLGVVAGVALASRAVASVPDAFARTIGSPLQVSVSVPVLGAVWLAGVGTSLLAAVAPARRALHVEPIEALRPDRDAGMEARVVAHPVVLGVGSALLVAAALAPSGAVPATVWLGAGFVGLLALIYGCAPLFVRLPRALARRMGSAGELAAASLHRSPRRAWACTASVVVAIAIAVVTSGLADNLRATMTGDLRTALGSDYWIGTTGGDTIAVTGLPTSWTADLAAVPGVGAVAGSTWLRVRSGPHIVGIEGVLGDSAYPFSRLADDQARAEMIAGRGAIVLRQYARAFGKQIGDMIDLPDASPPLRLPIVAITDAVSPSSGGMINISYDLLVAHYGVNAIARYEVRLAPGADRTAVQAQLERIANGAGFPVQVITGTEFFNQLSRSADQVLGLVVMVLLVIVVCAGVAVLNTLLASVLERTRELAVLRAIGATRQQLVRSVACEAAAIGLTGGLGGAAGGLLFHAIAVVGGATPARRVARLDLLDALNA